MNEQRTPSPWLLIPAADYEGHMGPTGAGQLGPLQAIFDAVYRDVAPECLLILGCGTGNGFGCVDPTITHRLVGVDLNAEYLNIARQRYPGLASVLELICADALDCTFAAEAFHHIHCALLFEYVDPAKLLDRLVPWLAPSGVLSVVLQLPSAHQAAVTPTRYVSLRVLEGVMRLVPPESLNEIAMTSGLRRAASRTVRLPMGKRFHIATYLRI